MDALVSTEWLAAALGATDLKIVDATQVMADTGRVPSAEFEAGHIPGAVHMDLVSLVDASNPVVNMAPPPPYFAERMAALGISDGCRIVVYDNAPHKTAARAWWMFRLFGIDNVAVLDGGLAKWQAEGRPLETGPAVPTAVAGVTVEHVAALVRDKADITANLTSAAEQLVDARGAARFSGAEDDPRPGIAAGHIPGSHNVPYDTLFNPDGTYLPVEALTATFKAAGVDLRLPMVTTCGSGVTAAVVLFAAYLTGKRDLALYDGSWSEWGADTATPKATNVA
jgi:thiosulfate/3-mercaptopyruvate sulfurtransferase